MYLEHYLNKLDYKNTPYFLAKYLNLPIMERLKKVGYFCGMDYASKDIYKFREHITRFDHSLTTALLTYKLTHDKKATISALLHDATTPCFSHVIDYMNKDYELQESTEEYHYKILSKSNGLKQMLFLDNLELEDIVNFKDFSIVDNNRPKLCADRLDGIILTSISWTKNIELEDIDNIIDNIIIVTNEDNEQEIGFKDKKTAKKVVELSNSIDLYCHSKEDNYMMELLAKITKYAIDKKYITYNDLYKYNEDELLEILISVNDTVLNKYLIEFKTKKISDISVIDIPVKKRILNPIVKGNRIK